MPSDGFDSRWLQKILMLSEKQRKRLLEIARSAIKTYLSTRKKICLDESDPCLCQPNGVFVSLYKGKQLRGCIGRLSAEQPLFLSCSDMAVEAAVNDPRFPPLEIEELAGIDIEISVLSPLKRISKPDEIKLGVHGVLISKGYRSGVFLPQVAIETGWSKEEFLSNLCTHKAGLPASAWQQPTSEIYIFSAEVFSEKN